MAAQRQLVVATGNQGKLAELSLLLQSLPLTLVSQRDLNVEDADETATSFVENALIKARHASAQTGLPALADDSGLIVPALRGRPGVYSARYAGPRASDADNIDRLLREMRDLSGPQRHAQFYCLIVLLRHALDPTPLICSASWQGVILESARGQGGFGYDPVFYLPALDRSAAELSPAEKNRLSHRGQALDKLIKELTKAWDTFTLPLTDSA